MTPDGPRAVLAGGSGFIGTRLAADLAVRGYSVSGIGRSGPDARWGESTRIAALVDGADLLINLAGKSVGCRYTDRNRDEIYRSRVETTQQLHDAVSASVQPPRLWLNASTATIYRHATDRPQTEADGQLGSGFSVDVARNWERVFFAGDLPGTRRVAMRMAIVLGDGPALAMLARAARFGMGGAQLDGRWFPHRRYRGIGPAPTPSVEHIDNAGGRQRFSWIHIDDLVTALAFIDSHPDVSGPVNLASPGTSDNRTLMSALRRAVRAPVGIPAPRWLLEPGMWVLRQESELILKSRWAVPEVLQHAGFTFRWAELDAAVQDLVRPTKG
ncbi:MAG TPA: DUF1731 domain-containing protein [Propionibacteriaceae bacterium]